MIHQPVFIESSRKSRYQPRGTDVSVALDLMIHDIDLVLSLAASDIADIKAAGMTLVSEHLDVANVRIEFTNGCVATITASRIALINERRMNIYQPDAQISVDFATHEVIILKKENTSHAGQGPGLETETRSGPGGDALMDELRSFVQCVKTRETPVVSGEMGRDALRVALDIEAKIEKT
jgi:predicted dehydrogenase